MSVSSKAPVSRREGRSGRGQGEEQKKGIRLTPHLHKLRPLIVSLCQQSQKLLVGDTAFGCRPVLVIANAITGELVVAEIEVLIARVVA
jgi:hypothetical protein